MPRPSHESADFVEQEEWKKSSPFDYAFISNAFLNISYQWNSSIASLLSKNEKLLTLFAIN
ncbi:hypothetical protein [Nostoc sp. LPT]|uniref:hypothetical protein n=1 Tax=Nostoc sp. LPT TaxID=2815387 RepID=UPI001D80CF35|nr:hypothetical protein [Nostoc sp. LPT]MBN4002097.1 hypothetical protein [Nostoc sp. LPT]